MVVVVGRVRGLAPGGDVVGLVENGRARAKGCARIDGPVCPGLSFCPTNFRLWWRMGRSTKEPPKPW